MNKKEVNLMLADAHKAIKDHIQEKNGKVKSGFWGQISSFGAAITGGSLPAAILFFSEKGGAEVDRSKIVKAIYYILNKKEGVIDNTMKSLFDYVKDYEGPKKKEKKENVINAAIALKLALNLFPKENRTGDDKRQEKDHGQE